jgi:PAS domain S-box-containing protein
MPDYAKLSKPQLIRQLKTLEARLKTNRPQHAAHLEQDLQVYQIELEMQNRELRETQQRLEETRDRYAELYDFAPVGYLTLDERSHILEINLTAAALLGHERARLLGKPLSTWFTGPDKHTLLAHLASVFHNHGARKATLDTRLATRTGQTIDVRLETVAAASANELARVCRTILLDVSTQRAAERALIRERDFAENLVATAKVIVLVLDTRGRIVRINPYMEMLSGYRQDEVVGKDWFSTFLPKHLQKRTHDIFQNAVQGKRTQGNVNPIVTRNGHERLIEWHDNELHDQHGNILGLLAIGMDVTEKLQLRLEAETHRENLAHLLRVVTLNELASGLTHELSQPLTAITSYTQELLRRLPEGSLVSSTTRHALEQSLVQSQRAAGIIQHLRHFVGKHIPEKVHTDINKLVRQAIELIGSTISKSAVTVKLDLCEDLPQVYVDGLLVEQVILNLVQNAIDAMPESGLAKREVTIQTSLLNDQCLSVTVSDLGAGFSPEQRARLFEPFFTTKQEGLGMGLAICRTIIEAHGGILTMTPNRPHGSQFRFTLPTNKLSHA